MVELRSGSKKGNDSVVASKGVTKVMKSKPKIRRVPKINKANKISLITKTAGDVGVSSAPLQSLSLSGFGSLTEIPDPSSGHAAQAVRQYEIINPPNRFSGKKNDWPYFKTMFEIYVEEKLPSLQVDLMSPEGYDDATEKMIYNWFMKLMDHDTYGIVNPTGTSVVSLNP